MPKPPKLPKSSPRAPGLQLTSHRVSSLQMFASTKASIFVQNLKTAREKLSSGICVSNRVFESVPTSAGIKKKSKSHSAPRLLEKVRVVVRCKMFVFLILVCQMLKFLHIDNTTPCRPGLSHTNLLSSRGSPRDGSMHGGGAFHETNLTKMHVMKQHDIVIECYIETTAHES